MRAALIQLSPQFGDVEGNRVRALRMMESTPAHLYVLPELFPSGYTFARAEELAGMAEPAVEGPTYRAIVDFARRHGAAVCYGFAEQSGGKFYNSANAVGPDGLATTYRKMHLFGREKLFFAPGDAPAPVVTLAGARVGLMICFDWYFPEVARSLALRGAQVILHPSNLVLPHCPEAMITRSLENRVFSLTCDRVGVERNGEVEHRFIGSSQAVSPRGEIMARLSRDREESTAVEFDPLLADNKSIAEQNDLFADRRVSLY